MINISKNEIIDKRKESQIQSDILYYLEYKKIFARRNNNTPVPIVKNYKIVGMRKFTGLKGVADIIGIYKNKPLAIEVKNYKGKLSIYQENFKIRFEAEGGIYINARSIDDVKKSLQNI